MPMKRKALVRWSESRTLRALDAAVRGSDLRVFTKVRLEDVIGIEPGEVLPPEDRNFLKTSHLDFLICERGGALRPAFAVEFDGPHHHQEPYVTRDIRKNRLCAKARLPLIRITDSALREAERLTVLEFMLQGALAARRKEARRDQTFEPNLTVARRLFGKHKIVTPFTSTILVRSLPTSAQLRILSMMSKDAASPDPNEVVKECEYTLYELPPGVRRFEFKDGKVATAGVTVLREGLVRFGLQWILPVVHDFARDEAPIEYLGRRGKMPYVHAELPGLHIPDIAESFAEYLALIEIERWAKRHIRDT